MLAHPIPRSDLREDPGFANPAIIRMPGGGNPFPVTPAEWQALQSHIETTRGSEPSPAQAVN